MLAVRYGCYFYSLLLMLPLQVQAQAADYEPLPAQISYQAVANLASDTPTATLQYGRDKLQFGQLWLPATSEGSVLQQGDSAPALFPTVIFIHGGCWLSDYDIAHTQAFSKALSEQGYAVWSIEYRRVGDSGGGWPGTFQDVANGVDYVHGLARRYPLDLSRAAIVGHSSGGHLALWAASRRGFSTDSIFYAENPLAIKVVVSLAGIADIVTFAEQGGSCGRVLQTLFSGSPTEVPQRYQLGTPLDISALGVQLVMLQGEADTIVPDSQARSYLKSLSLPVKAQGSDPVLQRIQDAGHFDWLFPGSRAWGQLLEVLQQRLAK